MTHDATRFDGHPHCADGCDFVEYSRIAPLLVSKRHYRAEATQRNPIHALLYIGCRNPCLRHTEKKTREHNQLVDTSGAATTIASKFLCIGPKQFHFFYTTIL